MNVIMTEMTAGPPDNASQARDGDPCSSVLCSETIIDDGVLPDVDHTAENTSFHAGRDAEPQAHQIAYVQGSQKHIAPSSQSGPAITPTDRANAVDRMIALGAIMGLDNDVLFLGVACLDKYLAATMTLPQMLQPVSIACLWVAGKYESATAPRAAVFASLISAPQVQSIRGNLTPLQLLLWLEADILGALDYRLASIITTRHHKHAITHCSPTTDSAPKMEGQRQLLYSMTSYLTEVSLLEYQLLPCHPSQLAAASHALAHVLLGMHLDCKRLPEVTGHTFAELEVPLQYLCALHTTLYQALADGRPYAVSVKYSSGLLHGVACVAPLVNHNDARLAARGDSNQA